MIAAGPDFEGRKLDVIHAAGMTVADIRSMTVAKGYEIVYVDYLQIIRPERGWRGNRYEIVTSLSMDLHAMAKSLGVLVVANTQLRRPPDGNEYKPPTLADLRESGQIEQDADVAMLLYKRKSDWPTPPRDLLIAKNKKGRLVDILRWHLMAQRRGSRKSTAKNWKNVRRIVSHMVIKPRLRA